MIVVLIFDSILNHTDDNFVATATVVLIVVMHSLDDERRVGNGIIAGISVDNELIALLRNESDKAKPVAVFAAAH